MRQDIDVARRTIGINFNANNEAEVKVWSPLANAVGIKVNGDVLPLQKDEFGFWETRTDKIAPGDMYKVLINEEKELPDPASLSQPAGVHAHSEAINLTAFDWQEQGWKNLSLQDYIIYELHTGTFSEPGTFPGVIDKLSYLKDLGITAIEIMPVAQFPGSRNWGYDGVFPFAVQDSYGGAKGLQQLVNACHQKGIAVILDVVYNHMGPEGNYLGEFGPYFTNKYNTPWGNALNFDDAYCDGVRSYFIENVLMWFRDFHIDALRMDAVHAIKDFSATHMLREIKEHVNALQETTGRQHHLIVELDLNDTKFINPLHEQGFGMDAQWIDEFHHALRVAAGGETTGYYSDFNGLEHLAKSYTDAYVYDGQYSPHRKKFFGIKAENNPGSQFIAFSQNHDQVGNRMLGERTSQLHSIAMQKLLAGAVMVAPYLPMLFMGEEYSEPNPFLYFVSHTDPELAEAVRKGRKEEFAAFHAEGEAPDPNLEETFTQSKLQWQLLQDPKHQLMLAYYRQLIVLRKQEAALRELNRKQVDVHVNKDANTLILHRSHQDESIVCLMNFSQQEQPVRMPSTASRWQKLLASNDVQWGGKTDAASMLNENEPIQLQPESIIIYKTKI
jgi:maltooligosyltrehalose trehalohydrolase